MKETTLTLANRFDTLLIGFSAKLGVPFLRFSIGIVFIWFGALKFFGHLSPSPPNAGHLLATGFTA
jgi:hypothetical protein